jgi:hypothetical protein
MKENYCITYCNRTEYLFHPFIGCLYIDSKTNNCIPQIFKNNFTKECNIDINNKIKIDPINSIKTIINPNDYLKYYYNIHTLNGVIKYFKNNINLEILTKNRILYFTIINYIDELENYIDKWINLIKICLNYNFKDKKIVNILKRIKKLYNNNKLKYEYNYLKKIKNYLDK